MLRTWWVPAVLAVGLVVGGCGAGDAGPSSEPSPEPSSSSTPTTTETATASPSPEPYRTVAGLERCGPQPARVGDLDLRGVVLREPGRGTLPAVVTGRGRTVAVLVHQTDGGGLCGWLGFVAGAAGAPGVTLLAPDLCGYGEARCGDGYADRQVEQVRLAVDYAAGELEASRIVLVGASMGGSLAVLAAAEDPRVDSVVDLSGPDDWAGQVVSVAARRLRAPALVAMATDEGSASVDAARATAAAAPRGSEFVEPASGHGYELLAGSDGRRTDLAARVLAWIRAS